MVDIFVSYGLKCHEEHQSFDYEDHPWVEASFCVKNMKQFLHDVHMES